MSERSEGEGEEAREAEAMRRGGALLAASRERPRSRCSPAQGGKSARMGGRSDLWGGLGKRFKTA